jgi:nucleotide-binding universal stress UspA family protein
MREMRVDHVLAPVDLGHSSEAALRCAQTIVARVGAKLTLMFVNDALTLQSYDEIYTGYRNLPPDQEEMMEDAVRAWANPLLGTQKYDVLVVADDPARAIGAAAGRHEADLIVMGTHARQGWQRLVDGSIAESVLHVTDRPVIAVPHNAPTRGISNVVAAVNFTEIGRAAARAACCMAGTFGAQLHLMHVTEQPVPNAAEKLRAWIDPVVSPTCEYREIIAHGNAAAEKVVEFASRSNADIIIVGAQHRKFSGARATIGTTTERILRLAPMPVMSVVRPLVPDVVEEPELAATV